MTIQEFATLIAERLNKPYDIKTIETIKLSIASYRAEFLRQDIEKDYSIVHYKQFFTMPLVDAIGYEDCPSSVANLGCKVLRSKYKVPFPIRKKSENPFIYVGEATGKNPFTYTKLEDSDLTSERKYGNNADIVGYDYINQYLYVFTKKAFGYIGINDAFESPEEIYEYCTDKCFNPLEDDYPLTLDLFSRIKRVILKEEFGIIIDDTQVKVKPELNADNE